jgi:hypothetical protein
VLPVEVTSKVVPLPTWRWRMGRKRCWKQGNIASIWRHVIGGAGIHNPVRDRRNKSRCWKSWPTTAGPMCQSRVEEVSRLSRRLGSRSLCCWWSGCSIEGKPSSSRRAP